MLAKYFGPSGCPLIHDKYRSNFGASISVKFSRSACNMSRGMRSRLFATQVMLNEASGGSALKLSQMQHDAVADLIAESGMATLMM